MRPSSHNDVIVFSLWWREGIRQEKERSVELLFFKLLKKAGLERCIFRHSRGHGLEHFLGACTPPPVFCITPKSYQHLMCIVTVKQCEMLFPNY